MSENEMKGAKIRLGIFAVLFFACMILGIYFINEVANRVMPREIERGLKQLDPVIREFLEQNREHFDVLTRGGFMEQGVRVERWERSTPERPELIVLSYHAFPDELWRFPERVAYADWDTVEWLSTEEIYALSYLINSRWFRDIHSFNDEQVIFFSPDLSFLANLISMELLQMPRLTHVEYNPSIAQSSSIERQESSSPASGDLYIYRRHLEDAYYLNIRWVSGRWPIDNSAPIMGIIVACFFALFFTIHALAYLNQIRKAKKQGEIASQPDFATSALANLNQACKAKDTFDNV